MAGEPLIRPATVQDLDDLVRLEECLFPLDSFSRSQLRHLLTRAHATTLVVAEQGQVCGSAVVAWRRNSRVGRLFSIAVAPPRQGRGLGSQLLAACEEEARRRDCRQLRLEVRADNAQAIGLYEGRGYRVLKTVPGYYPDGTDGVRMAKDLGTTLPQ